MVVWCTQNFRRDGSSFMWHQPCLRCKYTTSGDIQKRAIKRGHLCSPCKTKLFRPRQEVKEDNSVRDADQLYGKNWRDSFVHHADHAVLGNWTGQLCSPCRPNCMAGSGENSSVRHTDHDVLRNWRGQLCSPCRPSCTQQLERTALFAMQTKLYTHARKWREQLCSQCIPHCPCDQPTTRRRKIRADIRSIRIMVEIVLFEETSNCLL